MKIISVIVTSLCLFLATTSVILADTKEDFIELACKDMKEKWGDSKCRCLIGKSISLLSDEQWGLLQMALDSHKNQENLNEEQKKADNEFYLKHYGELIEQIRKIFESKKNGLMKQCGITEN